MIVMHVRTRQYALLVVAVVFVVISFAAPALAQEEKSPLTPEEETKLLDLASALAEPPHMEIKAVLTPPATFYTVQLVPAEKKRIDDLIKQAKEFGLSGSVDVSIDEERWRTGVACGTFNAGDSISTWVHPEGTPPSACPHEDGASHAGTIGAPGSVHLTFGKDGVTVLRVISVFMCSYSGSESGTEPCETELEQFSGFYGGMFSERYGFSTNDNSGDIWNTAWIYVGVTLVIAGTGFVFFRRKPKK